MSGLRLEQGDCAEVMASMESNSVDAIVTDPPYGLAFMGADWDTFGRSKPYGNDSMDVRREKALDYANEHSGAPRYGNGHGPGKLTADEALSFQTSMTPVFEETLRVAKPGAYLLCFGGTRTFHRMACAIEDAGWEIRDCIMWVYGSGFPKSMDVAKAIEKKHGADAAAQWDGWGTCLKPAWEPIIVARKPLDGTVAHNVLTWGVGALNIDACRVPTEDNLNGGAYSANSNRSSLHGDTRSIKGMGMFAPGKRCEEEYVQPSGRFPANLVHDGSQMVLDLFPQSKGQQGDVAGSEPSRPTDGVCYGEYNERQAFAKRGDSGSAARFFYCAKANKKDRGEGNDHPTVKPTELMSWLVRLVTPRGGVVLDPFMGSGSTGVAAKREGMGFIGIERDGHYFEIARNRLESEPATLF